MTRRRDSSSSLGQSNDVRCPVCNDNLSIQDGRPVHWWTYCARPPTPVHCVGSQVAWPGRSAPIPHHGRRAYRCWRCRESLGCDQCAGSVTEVLCDACLVWGTVEAFAQHGAITNHRISVEKRGNRLAPQYADYPPRWRDVHDAVVVVEEQRRRSLSTAELRETIRDATRVIVWDDSQNGASEPTV